ncbi:hydroxysqualene dehydroxylase HpnE [Herminiimonas sp. CN]|uniref:hydroxysqualene dehydroxylase HpnE n=1 Tax=Herminiimonas sp. CN TaxID=1349818 RepID=UPI0004737375|nr:hydroxysqualene dehydroxylase HpnE [Herminiimonas sp. CN]
MARRPGHKQSKNVAVIGGGWAGCAAAVRSVQDGHQVTLYETARTLGGRARRIEIKGKSLDNGQHILLGAYRDTLRLMAAVGVDPHRALLRLPLQMRYPAGGNGMDFIAPRLPAPLHLLVALWRSTGLRKQDKLALARFSSAARWMDWRLNDDCSVAELLQRFEQTERLIRLMWQPLCVAALNTPIQRASAQVFLAVLRDSFGARRAASDMLIPRTDLSTLFPQHAADFLLKHGATVHLGAAVHDLAQQDEGWHVASGKPNASGHFDAIILATPPDRASALLAGLPQLDSVQMLRRQLDSFQYEAITTCYLQYGQTVRLPMTFMALQDNPASGSWGQFVFDRGQLDPAHAGLLSVVISTSQKAVALGRVALAGLIGTQLANTFNQPELAAPQWATVISEKRATFSCTPALKRPANTTSLPALFLAGDYTASDYPATIESAVRSGVQAAQFI